MNTFNVNDVLVIGFIYIGTMIYWLSNNGIEFNVWLFRGYWMALGFFTVNLVLYEYRRYMLGGGK